MTQRIAFLHGLGESPKNWIPLANILHAHGFEVITPSLFAPHLLEHGWSVRGAASEIAAELSPQPAHIVGHALGAVTALQLALDHPELVSSLCLSAPQAKPPQLLMAAQSLMMRFLPEQLVCPEGLSKTDLLSVLDAVTSMDIEPKLPHIEVPTTILCGDHDHFSLKAAQKLSQLIPNAHLHEIADGSHELPYRQAAIFTKHLLSHLGIH